MSALMLVENTDRRPSPNGASVPATEAEALLPRRALLSAMRTEDMHLPPMNRPLPVLCRP
jgi:hypothetical protein